MFNKLFGSATKKTILSDSYSGYGLYGKIPSVGDFVNRNISHQITEIFDTWFQTGMQMISSGKNDYYRSYLVAPVWRFLLPANIVDGRSRAGLLMASADSIGRYFPLVIISHQHLENSDTLPTLCSELAHLSRFLPSVLQERTQPDLLLKQLNTTHIRFSGHNTINHALTFNTSGQSSLWWAQNQQGQQTHITHKSSLNGDLFSKLFMENQIYV